MMNAQQFAQALSNMNLIQEALLNADEETQQMVFNILQGAQDEETYEQAANAALDLNSDFELNEEEIDYLYNHDYQDLDLSSKCEELLNALNNGEEASITFDEIIENIKSNVLLIRDMHNTYLFRLDSFRFNRLIGGLMEGPTLDKYKITSSIGFEYLQYKQRQQQKKDIITELKFHPLFLLNSMQEKGELAFEELGY